MAVIYTQDEINQVISNTHCYISKLSLKMIDEFVLKSSSYLEDRFFYLLDLLTAIEDRNPFDYADPDFNQLIALLDSEVGQVCCPIDTNYLFIYSPMIVPTIVGRTFISLIDVPNSYVGHAGQIPQVNSTETGLIFVDPPGGNTDTIVRIIDSITPYVAPPTNPSGGGGGPTVGDGNFLYIVNRGDDSLLIYNPLTTDTDTIAPNSIYTFQYDGLTGTVPIITFENSELYALAPDGAINNDFRNSADSNVFLSQFTEEFLADYIIDNGNSNLNIISKNLIVNISGVNRPTITQLQIVDTNSVMVKYDALSSLGSDLSHLGSELDNSGHEIQVLVASTSPTTKIAITASNIIGVLYKTQNFLSSDPDNNLIAPITVDIQ